MNTLCLILQIHIHTYTRIHMYTHTYIHTHTYICIHAHAHMNTQTQTHRLWNLVRGKCAYHTKLPEEGLVVQFTPSTTPHDTNPPPNTATAQRYTLLCPHRLAVHDLAVEGGHGDGIVASWQLKHASQCVGWMHGVGGGGEGVLLVGSDDGGLRGYDPRVGGEAVMYVHKAHAVRGAVGAIPYTWCMAVSLHSTYTMIMETKPLPLPKPLPPNVPSRRESRASLLYTTPTPTPIGSQHPHVAMGR